MIHKMTENQITLHIIQTLKDNKKSEFESIVDELQPYDIAQIYESLPDKHRARFCFS